MAPALDPAFSSFVNKQGVTNPVHTWEMVRKQYTGDAILTYSRASCGTEVQLDGCSALLSEEPSEKVHVVNWLLWLMVSSLP